MCQIGHGKRDGLLPHSTTKTTWRWIKELNIKRNNYKILRRKHRNLHYLGLSKGFLHMIQIGQATTKTVNWHYQKVKIQTRKWEKIFDNYIHIISNSYPEYINNSYNSTLIKQIIQLKTGK